MPLPSSSDHIGVICGSSVRADDLRQQDPDSVATYLDRHSSSGLLPHDVDHEANMRSLQDQGCNHLLAINSVGSLRLDWPVGTIVAPDDFYAPAITTSIFDDQRAHQVHGLDAGWRSEIAFAWRAVSSVPIEEGGVYAQTRGPRFETPAEVRVLAMAADLVGMTLASECIIASEFELPYASICIVDNMANGLGHNPLQASDHKAGVAANRALLVETIPKLVAMLASMTTTSPESGEPGP